MHRNSFTALPMILSLTAGLAAEQGKLMLHVSDTDGHPVANLSFSTLGAGGSPQRTDPTGRAILLLTPGTKENSLVQLQIVKSPNGHEFVLVDPWKGRPVQVPSFENNAMNVVMITVAERGASSILRFTKPLEAQIIQANAPKIAGKRALSMSSKEGLEVVSKQYGLSPKEVDETIRTSGKKATSPYDKGLAALYEQNYTEATKQLTTSLQILEQTDKSQSVDAASFLGDSLFAQGRYREAAVAQDRALKLQPDNPSLMNAKALSLYHAGDYIEAEPLYRNALSIREKTLGDGYSDTATSLNNLALLLKAKGDYAGAETLYRHALAIHEKVLGSNNIRTAVSLNNLALILVTKGDYAGAEPLCRRAIAIDEAMLGAYDPATATDLNSLALVLKSEGDYAGAEPVYRRVLQINETALGPNHPNTASSLGNLAIVLVAKGDYAGAEPLYRRAIQIDETVLGTDHPDTAIDYNNLARLLDRKGSYADAEILYRRALSIDEKSLGPDHPTTKMVRNNLALARAKLR